MRHFTVMIKPASSQCNMRCRYCFYSDVASRREVSSYGVMTSETVRSMLRNVFCDLKETDKITFSFQGGEPLLAGIKYFESFVRIANELGKKSQIEYTLQTNGTLLNEKWCSFFKENRFLIGLSLDGPEEFHDRNRIDQEGRGTYLRVTAAKDLLDKYDIEYNILAVLTNELAGQPEEFWKMIRKLDVIYVQLIPCLDELEGERKGSYILTPQRFAYFYCKLFELWKRDFSRNEIVSIKLFDDLLNLFVNKICTACGMTGRCSPQIVIEADGSVYPCDFYVLDEYKIGSITNQSIIKLLSAQKMRDFLNRPRLQNAMCEICRYKFICGGGCERMRKEVCGLEDSLFCGYQSFLDAKIDELFKMAEQIIKEQES